MRDHRGRPARRAGFAFLFVVLGSILFGASITAGFAVLTGPRRTIGLLVPFLVLLVLAWRARRGFRSTWRPARELIDAATELAGGDETVRVSVPDRGPLRAIASAFNDLATRLQGEARRRERLLADVSHEVRTPLTVIRGEVEAIRDGIRLADETTLAGILGEVEVMDRLLDDLRTITLAEAGQLELEVSDHDIGTIARSVADAMSGMAAERDVTIDAEAEHVTAAVDAVRIREVLTNLVGNATRHARSRVVIRVDSAPGAVHMSVIDDGPGIDDEERDRIFERWVRAADSTGSGLGLSIARDLVVAHAGTIEVVDRPDGAEFRVVLPQ